ncbi:Transcriptional regulatory protein RosR (fragment) [Mesorhizobium plurifarium]|uniref:Transcriptional regulatory protein RosR n=1 Tax=Mesorhizobium plurifarium TaxID=69974 RepID=A0A090FGY7_MESPL
MATHFGLTPDEYREKWGLPPDYPMVAPTYSESRSSLAKALGLGRKTATKKKAPVKRGRGR